jgi:hypothetical protein
MVGVEGSCCVWSHSMTHTHHSVGLLWTRDRPVAETSTWQRTTLTIDKSSMSPAKFELAIPGSERTQIYTSDGAATGIGVMKTLQVHNTNKRRQLCYVKLGIERSNRVTLWNRIYTCWNRSSLGKINTQDTLGSKFGSQTGYSVFLRFSQTFYGSSGISY